MREDYTVPAVRKYLNESGLLPNFYDHINSQIIELVTQLHQLPLATLNEQESSLEFWDKRWLRDNDWEENYKWEKWEIDREQIQQLKEARKRLSTLEDDESIAGELLGAPLTSILSEVLLPRQPRPFFSSQTPLKQLKSLVNPILKTAHKYAHTTQESEKDMDAFEELPEIDVALDLKPAASKEQFASLKEFLQAQKQASNLSVNTPEEEEDELFPNFEVPPRPSTPPSPPLFSRFTNTHSFSPSPSPLSFQDFYIVHPSSPSGPVIVSATEWNKIEGIKDYEEEVDGLEQDEVEEMRIWSSSGVVGTAETSQIDYEKPLFPRGRFEPSATNSSEKIEHPAMEVDELEETSSQDFRILAQVAPAFEGEDELDVVTDLVSGDTGTNLLIASRIPIPTLTLPPSSPPLIPSSFGALIRSAEKSTGLTALSIDLDWVAWSVDKDDQGFREGSAGQAEQGTMERKANEWVEEMKSTIREGEEEGENDLFGAETQAGKWKRALDEDEIPLEPRKESTPSPLPSQSPMEVDRDVLEGVARYLADVEQVFPSQVDEPTMQEDDAAQSTSIDEHHDVLVQELKIVDEQDDGFVYLEEDVDSPSQRHPEIVSEQQHELGEGINGSEEDFGFIDPPFFESAGIEVRDAEEGEREQEPEKSVSKDSVAVAVALPRPREIPASPPPISQREVRHTPPRPLSTSFVKSIPNVPLAPGKQPILQPKKSSWSRLSALDNFVAERTKLTPSAPPSTLKIAPAHSAKPHNPTTPLKMVTADVEMPFAEPDFLKNNLPDSHKTYRIVISEAFLSMRTRFEALTSASIELIDRPRRFEPEPYRDLEPHLVVDGTTCVLYRLMIHLVSNVERLDDDDPAKVITRLEPISSTLLRLSNSVETIVLILEESTADDPKSTFAYTPPIMRALEQLKVLIERISPTCRVQVAIARSPSDSARIGRRLLLHLESSSDGEFCGSGLDIWADRSWLVEDMSEDERVLIEGIPMVNAFTGVAISTCCTAQAFFDMDPEDRNATFSHLCGERIIAQISNFIAICRSG